MNDKIIAHRGASGHAPENTLIAFAEAAELGARWIEFDVKLTRDGAPVVFHDDALERTTDGKGPIAAWDLEDLRRLDAGAWFDGMFRGEAIPTLGETLSLFVTYGLCANVEIKPCPGREAETGRAVALALENHGLGGLLLSSFSVPALEAARDVAPGLARALNVDAAPGDWRDRLTDLNCQALHCNHKKLSRSEAVLIRENGFDLRCYTVNDYGRAETLFGWGVRSVFTDYPDRLL